MADVLTPWEIVAPVEKRELSQEHRLHLNQSGISDEVIDKRGYYSLTKAMVYALVQLEQYDLAAIKAESWLGIPVYRPDGFNKCDVLRLFGSQSYRKYIWPRGQTNLLDVHPDCIANVRDREIPILFTEGSKKIDAILTAARAEGMEVVVVSVNGCWGWKGDANGGKAALADFQDIPLNDRQVYVISDSDFRNNNNVRAGWSGAAHYIESKTGEHRTFLVVVPPEGLVKQGADDYLAAGGSLQALLGLAQSVEYAVDNQPSQRAPILLKSGKRLIEEAGEHIPHLITPVLPERAIMLMTGHSGTFKTWHGLSLMLDLAFGLTWLGHPDLTTHEPITSLYVNKEMSGSILGQRLKFLAKAERYATVPNADEIIEQRLAFADEAAIDLKNPGQRDRLEEAIMDSGARMVFLDSLSMCWTGEENSSTEVGQFYSQMRGITERCGNAWCIIHHMLKPQNHNKKLPVQFAIRGSGQLYQQADAALILSNYDPDGPHADGVKEVAIAHAKARTSIELPSWLTRFSTNDGQYATIDYTGRVAESKARAYSESSGDTAKLAGWVWESLQAIPMMDTTGPGVRTGALISLLQANWTIDEKAPSESSLKRQMDRFLAEGVVEVMEENKRLGNLWRIREMPDDDGSSEP